MDVWHVRGESGQRRASEVIRERFAAGEKENSFAEQTEPKINANQIEEIIEVI